MNPDDFDVPEIFEETWPVARKQHRCCECGKTIQAGEKYARIKGLWDNEFNLYKQCLECNSLMMFLQHEFGCICYLGGLFDCMKDSEITMDDVQVRKTKLSKEQNNG